MTLEKAQAKRLLELARQTLVHHFGLGPKPETAVDPVFQQDRATFVTLKKKKGLRGCIGNLQPVSKLWKAVADNTRHAAFHDRRFSPLIADELPEIQIGISVLTEPVPLKYSEPQELTRLLRPGTDGVILRLGERGATFLPQVWEDLPEPDRFLSQLCLKAGLAGDTWRHTVLEIEIYQVQSFTEEDI